MQIQGKYITTVYENEKYGVSIAIYKVDGKSCTITGSGLPTFKNINYLFNGEYVNNPKYGRQFKADSYEQSVGNDKESIENFLSSGIIKGIGPVMAKRIVSYFGEETMDIMNNRIDALMAVKGITLNKLIKIKESYKSNIMYMEIAVELGKYGISPKMAAKIYDKFGETSMDIVHKEPYKLCGVPGITFTVADAMGVKTPEYETSYDRFKMAAQYVLYANENNGLKDIIGDKPSGSLGIDKNDFGKAMLKLLQINTIDEYFILDKTIRMIKEGELVFKKQENGQMLYLPGIYRIETALATNIARIAMNNVNCVTITDEMFRDAERKIGIVLGEQQIEAIRKAFKSNLSLIVGPPGTGKTTILKFITYFNELLFGSELVFMAPSAKAASNMKETTNKNASTVHSGLEIGTDIISDTEMIEIKFYDCLIDIDEMSMLDVRTAYRLFSSIDESCRVVINGDDEQLQSVGAGAVLRDMIESDVLPVTILDTIYRQQDGSDIYYNSIAMRKGIADLHYGEKFAMHETSNTKEMETSMIQTYLEKVNQYGIDNVMLISPFKEHDGGVYNLNAIIQQYLNPGSKSRSEFKYGTLIYRVGDIVMQLKNHTEENIVNGDIGVISHIDMNDGDPVMTVTFNGNTREYTRENIAELILAYAYTVHKAQGSEAKCVITCMHMMHSVMLKKNVIYTAITRAKEEVQIFGQKEALIKAIKTEDKARRNTSLKYLLRLKFGEFLPISEIPMTKVG